MGQHGSGAEKTAKKVAAEAEKLKAAAGVDNTARKKWDREEYAQKAE